MIGAPPAAQLAQDPVTTDIASMAPIVKTEIIRSSARPEQV
jgi:hypothetical protein